MCLYNFCKAVIPTLRGSEFIRFESMGIQPQRNAGIRVTEPLRDGRDRYALAEQLTGVHVSQRMQTDARQARFRSDFRHSRAYLVRLIVRPIRTAKNRAKTAVGWLDQILLISLVLHKNIQRYGWQ
jgi:hypothetical protein